MSREKSWDEPYKPEVYEKIRKGELREECDGAGCKKRATTDLVVNGKNNCYCREHARWMIESI